MLEIEKGVFYLDCANVSSLEVLRAHAMYLVYIVWRVLSTLPYVKGWVYRNARPDSFLSRILFASVPDAKERPKWSELIKDNMTPAFRFLNGLV